MTTIQGQFLRPRSYAMFSDLTDVPVSSFGADSVTFDAELDQATADAIWWRLTSRDDAHEQARRSLAAAVAALEPPAPVLADQVAALQAAVCQAASLLLGTD